MDAACVEASASVADTAVPNEAWPPGDGGSQILGSADAARLSLVVDGHVLAAGAGDLPGEQAVDIEAVVAAPPPAGTAAPEVARPAPFEAEAPGPPPARMAGHPDAPAPASPLQDGAFAGAAGTGEPPPLRRPAGPDAPQAALPDPSGDAPQAAMPAAPGEAQWRAADAHAEGPGQAPSPAGPVPVAAPSAGPPLDEAAAGSALQTTSAETPEAAPAAGASPRNIVLIAVDDLSVYASLLGAYAEQVHTPNLDRLAARGVTFTDAQAAVPLCGPSRAAMMTGMTPLSTGVFGNSQYALDSVDADRALPARLQDAGYTTATAGKIFHGLSEADAARFYDVVLSTSGAGAENGDADIIRTLTTAKGGIYTGDPERLGDAKNVAAVEAFLQGYEPDPDSAGLFLSVGLKSVHAPRVVPQEYYDLYPLEAIRLPEVPADDLADVPDFAQGLGSPRVFDRLVAAGEWPLYVQSYLAAVSYMDAMLGRLLDAIDASAIGGDAVIALWSDNGYHLGEKGRTEKITLWEESTRVPLIIADPGADPARIGTRTDQVVGTIDLYATLLDYAGAPVPDWSEGESLFDFVRTGDETGLSGSAVSLIEGSFSLRTDRYRYTRYEDGSEELYDLLADPHAYANLADLPEFAATKATLAAELDAWLARFHYVANATATPTALLGGEGRDLLVAGFGSDTLAGGAGDDVYLLRLPTQAIREARDAGRDQVITGGDWTTYALPTNVEDLYFERRGEGATLPDFLDVAGNALGNVIQFAMDKIQTPVRVDGGGGDDTIGGTNLPSTLQGGQGGDSLTGGDRADSLDGGVGDDTALGLDDGDQLLGRGGNDHLSGGEGDDLLSGEDGADTLEGGAGDDGLEGGEGGDLFVASPGTDQITDTGVLGMDRLDLTPWGGRAGTTITEVRDAAGALVSVAYARNLSPIDRVVVLASGGANPLEAIVERGLVVLLRAQTVLGGAADDRFEGSRDGDRIEGGAGRDSLAGVQGADTLLGAAGDDELDGGEGNDSLEGGFGQDRMTGGTGGDTMAGGTGDDFYLVDAAGDVVREAAGQGRDTVSASVSWILGEALEVLVLTSDAARLGKGNGLDNEIRGSAASNTLRGEEGNDTLLGGQGADTLLGEAGQDSLVGGDGADSLVGGPGVDSMQGASGDDVYWVDSTLDQVFEARGGGNDTIQSSVSYVLPADQEVEALLLTGGAADAEGNGRANALRGNPGPNRLTGGGGADTLDGAGGNDTLAGGDGGDRLLGGGGADALTGGLGADLFVFGEPGAAAAADTIADFARGLDRIELGAAGFVGLAAGALPAANFATLPPGGGTAPAGTPLVVYDPATGDLWFDPDGAGGQSAMRFARLEGLPSLGASDFVVA